MSDTCQQQQEYANRVTRVISILASNLWKFYKKVHEKLMEIYVTEIQEKIHRFTMSFIQNPKPSLSITCKTFRKAPLSLDPFPRVTFMLYNDIALHVPLITPPPR